MFSTVDPADNVSFNQRLRHLHHPHHQAGFPRTLGPYLQSHIRLHMDLRRAKRRHHLSLSSNYA